MGVWAKLLTWLIILGKMVFLSICFLIFFLGDACWCLCLVVMFFRLVFDLWLWMSGQLVDLPKSTQPAKLGQIATLFFCFVLFLFCFLFLAMDWVGFGLVNPQFHLTWPNPPKFKIYFKYILYVFVSYSFASLSLSLSFLKTK